MSFSANEKIRVGICGAGQIIHNHCQAMTYVPELEPVAISSRTQKSANKMARKYGIKKAYEDHRRVIESKDVDLVLIATPNYLHAKLAIEAMTAGKHVMVEKPLAVTLAEGKKMVATAKKTGRQLIYAEQLPLAPKFAELIRLANKGTFGEIYMARQIERHAGPYSPWFFRRDTAGGGVLMDLGCHCISVIRLLFPNQKIIGVTGVERTFCHTQGDVDDFMLLQIHYENGAIGVVETNWCQLGGMDSITEVFGKEGQGYADLFKGSGLTLYTEMKKDGERGWRAGDFDHMTQMGYVAQAQGAVDAILTGRRPLQDGDDGLEILKIMYAAYKSARLKSKIVPLPI